MPATPFTPSYADRPAWDPGARHPREEYFGAYGPSGSTAVGSIQRLRISIKAVGPAKASTRRTPSPARDGAVSHMCARVYPLQPGAAPCHLYRSE